MDFVKNINADRENTDAFTEKLWMGIQNGDKDCYEKLFNEYSDKMLAYGMKYTTDRDLIKECIQSVFVYIFVNRKKLAAVHNTSGYLLTSFRHELFHSLNERSSRFSYLEEMPEFKLEVKFASQHIEKMDDESLKVRSQLIKAIDNLSPRQKEIIYLYYIQELPLKDVAQIMNMEYQSARNLLSRSLTHLRNSSELKDYSSFLSTFFMALMSFS